MKRLARFLLFAGLLLLVLAPIAFIATMFLYPFWSWIEATYGIESVGHSGPADWCFLSVYGLLAFAGILVLWRKLSRRNEIADTSL